jgi:mRNA interferase RelE/StbE
LNPPWHYELAARAERDLRQLDPPTRRRVIEALDRLAEEPFRGDIRKMHGAPNEWRLRVGDWRIRFERDVDGRTLKTLRILPRQSSYRP